MPEVQILSRSPGQRPGESGVPKPVLAVTYSTAAVPPRTVFIPGEAPTDEEVADAIRQDLEFATTAPPSTLTI